MANITMSLTEYEKLKKAQDDIKSVKKAQIEVEKEALQKATETLEKKYKKILDLESKYKSKYDKIKEEVQGEYLGNIQEAERNISDLLNSNELERTVCGTIIEIFNDIADFPWYKRMFINLNNYFHNKFDNEIEKAIEDRKADYSGFLEFHGLLDVEEDEINDELVINDKIEDDYA